MKKNLSILILSLAVLLPAYTHAAIDSYTLLEPLPCIDTTQPCDANNQVTKVDLNSYVGYIFKLIIALSAAIAVIRITWGGFQYMTTDAIGGKKEGKATITNAIYGLIMIFASYLILRTIDPRLVQIGTEIQPIVPASTVIDFSAFFADTQSKIDRLDKLDVRQAQRKQTVDALIKQIDDLDQTDPNYGDTLTKLQEQVKQIQKAGNADTYNTNALNSFEKINDAVNNNMEYTPLVHSIHGISTDDGKAEVQRTINDLSSSIDKNIQKLKDQGDTGAAASLQSKKDYYMAQANSDLYFYTKYAEYDDLFATLGNKKPSVLAVTVVAKANEIETNLKNYASTIKDPEFKATYLKNVASKVAQIEQTAQKYR